MGIEMGFDMKIGIDMEKDVIIAKEIEIAIEIECSDMIKTNYSTVTGSGSISIQIYIDFYVSIFNFYSQSYFFKFHFSSEIFIFYFSRGCNGGNPVYAFEYTMTNALTSWEDYPYKEAVSTVFFF